MDALQQLCRLCAKSKSSAEMMGEINDLLLGIKPKLIDCCRWRDLDKGDTEHLPQNACISCVQRLEECWEFAESVYAAQNKLLRMMDNFKLDPLGKESSMRIEGMEYDDEMLECDANLDPSDENIHIQEGFSEIDLSIVNENACGSNDPIQSTTMHLAMRHCNEDNNSSGTNRKKHSDKVQCEEISLNVKSNSSKQRNEETPKTATTKAKTQMLKKDEIQEILRQMEATRNLGKKPKSKLITNPLLNRRSRRRSEETFLASIRSEDRNDNGTINPERIRRLGLGSWLMLQYQCYLCGICSGDYYTLRQHILEEHPGHELRLLCSFCKKDEPRTVPRKQAMIDHTKRCHFPHLKFCCWKCNKFYWDTNKLREHVFGHKRLPNLKELVGVLCHHCGKTCRDDSHYRQHSLTHLPAQIKPTFECYACKKTYASKLALDYHMFNHIDGKKYKCDTCDFESKRKDLLKRHMKKHSMDLPFSCPDCGKNFKMKKSLEEHYRIHTGERPFQCLLCAYDTGDLRNMYKHIKQKHRILENMRHHFTIKANTVN